MLPFAIFRVDEIAKKFKKTGWKIYMIFQPVF